MAKYKKVDTDLKFVDREKEVEKFWNEEDIFKKSMENRKEGETYTLKINDKIIESFTLNNISSTYGNSNRFERR